MGGVFLGMPGPWAEDHREVADHYTTKIGGVPDWPIPIMDLRPGLLECGSCGNNLCLVAQVYAPISNITSKIEERIIYVFGCVMPKCGNNPISWQALRVQKCHSGEEESSSATEEMDLQATPSKPQSTNKWLEDDVSNVDNAVSDEEIDLDELGRLLSEASSLASHSKKQNGRHKVESALRCSQKKPIKRLSNANLPVIPCFYIYSQEEEELGIISAISSSYSLYIKKRHKEKEVWEEEGYEYDKALHVDRTYLKFKKRLDLYPEQCSRYSYGGRPLLATNEIDEPRNCECCGGIRHFEMQLMPPLLFFLREASGGSSLHSLEDWNWMTIILYTCSQSCSHPTIDDKSSNNGWTVAEETVIVQFE
ncbi:hypothetical protein GIB67_022615 [Kingdonia uniflora]|uniref:Programmed cell death protein 2 C-terminal domain-containing protein n=1 Tax=Kingdonia uniflora TaxID=39325 RepID=A0A7J7P8F8_9MAGN|nr:hypothetical protein GIB67_022615 [Kingdonia uniflora]